MKKSLKIKVNKLWLFIKNIDKCSKKRFDKFCEKKEVKF